MAPIKKLIQKTSSIFLKNKLWNLTTTPEYNYDKRFLYRLQIIDNILLNKAYGDVIEIGCGDGRFLSKLESIKGINSAWGINISIKGIKTARKKGLNVIRADGERLPFKDETFDTVMSANGAPVAMKWELLLPEVYRILKPGGYFAFHTYNKFPIEKIIKNKIMCFLKIANAPFLINGGVKNIKKFKAICLKFGFEIISLHTLLPLPFFPYGILLKGSSFSQIHVNLIGILRKKQAKTKSSQ